MRGAAALIALVAGVGLAVALTPSQARAQDAAPKDPCTEAERAKPIDVSKPRAEWTACELWRSAGPCANTNPGPINNDKALYQLTECELWRLGFEWESYRAHEPSLIAGLVAAGPGLVFNGFGHFYQGNTFIGWRLLLTEAIGLAIIGGGLLVLAAEESNIPPTLGVALVQTGGFAISTAYSTDVIGSSKGTNDILPNPTTMGASGYRAELGTRTLLAPEIGCDVTTPCSFAELALRADLGFFDFRLSTLQHVQANYAEYKADARLRVIQVTNVNDHVAGFLRYENASFDRSTLSLLPDDSDTSIQRLELGVDASLDMGELIDSLENVINRIQLGFGLAGGAGYRAAIQGDVTRTYIVAEQSLIFNLIPELRLRPHYNFDESNLLTPITTTIGTFGGEVQWTPWRDLRLIGDLEVGRGAQIHLSVAYTL